MSAAADAPASTQFSGSMLVWLLVSLLLFYRLSAGPFVFCRVLLVKLGWSATESAFSAFGVIYSPLEMLVSHVDILGRLIVGYVDFWAWIAECLT